MKRFLLLLLIVLLSCLACTQRVKEEITPVVNRDYFPTALEAFNGAKGSIHVILLVMSSGYGVDELKDALVGARKRGVEVKVLLEDGIKANQATIAYLRSMGIETKPDDGARLTHNKILIIDGEKVLLGATNWSTSSLNYNNETNVLIQSPVIADYFENYFQALWENSYQEPEINKVSTPRITPIVNREHFPYLDDLLKKAKKRIHIMMYDMRYYPQYPGGEATRLLNDLIAAKQRGVEVKVLLEKSDYHKRLNRTNTQTASYLKENGIEVKFDPEETITHSKLIIVDDVAVVGSCNWSHGQLERSHNSSVLINDPQVTGSYEEYFDNLWKQGSPF